MAVIVEVRSIFAAADQAEAESLLVRVMDAELDVVCPPGPERLTTCAHCAGTLVNPAEEAGDVSAGEEDRWAPGKPCAVCAETDTPGQEMPCAREHSAGAVLHLDGKWLTQDDRQAKALLARVLAALDAGDSDTAAHLVREAPSDLS